MRLTKPVKTMMMRELKIAFEKEISLGEFTEVFLFLDRWNTATKTVPYNIYFNDEYLMLTDTQAGVLFKDWLDLKISIIEDTFNKGRKITRQFKNLIQANRESLIYTMANDDIFKVVVASLFVEYGDRSIPFVQQTADVEKFNYVLNRLRLYIAAIFYIDVATGVSEVEDLLALFINKPKSNLVHYIVQVGLQANITAHGKKSVKH